MLRDRDKEILEHVHRYRLTTREVLYELFFDEQKPNAVSQVTSRLCRDGYLKRFLFKPPSTHYFVLGSKGTNFYGRGFRRTEPIGQQALPKHYATLVHCAMRQKMLLTRWEVEDLYPQYIIPKVNHDNYAISTDEGPIRLSLFRLDGNADPDHLVRVCGDDLKLRQSVPVFKELLEQRWFTLVLFTHTRQKAQRIQELVNARLQSTASFIQIDVIHDLHWLTTKTVSHA